jgi:hypothetical protein
MTVRLHTIARCLSPGCPWDADGPDADRQAHRHSDTTKRGGREHATATRTHPTTRCAQEGCTHD